MVYRFDVSSGFDLRISRPRGHRQKREGGGAAPRHKGMILGPVDVHLTTMRTLDIKLAILLQTLASTPGCPNVGSMDFGERLTVVLEEVSLLEILAVHVLVHIGRPLCQARMRRDRKARLGGSDEGRRWSLGEFDVLRARKRSSERMHMALRMRMTTGDGVSSWYVIRRCDGVS